MQNKFRLYTGDYLIVVEVGIYTMLALLLSAAGVIALLEAGRLLWEGVRTWSVATGTLRILDQLLLVLMIVEILHTVRISIRSHTLVAEPFLVVGLIASIRRMLVITLESADLTKPERWSTGGDQIFHASMIELGLLAGLILILVISISLLRRQHAPELTA